MVYLEREPNGSAALVSVVSRRPEIDLRSDSCFEAEPTVKTSVIARKTTSIEMIGILNFFIIAPTLLIRISLIRTCFIGEGL